MPCRHSMPAIAMLSVMLLLLTMLLLKKMLTFAMIEYCDD